VYALLKVTIMLCLGASLSARRGAGGEAITTALLNKVQNAQECATGGSIKNNSPVTKNNKTQNKEHRTQNNKTQKL
jgi:hypothetical protein